MKKITVQEIFSVEDLNLPSNADLKNRVIEKARLINVDDGWWATTYGEIIQNDLKPNGFFDIEISFSGFWSQGDGASFTGRFDSSVYLEKLISENPTHHFRRLLQLIKAGLLDDYVATIKRDRWNNYVHWNTTSIYFNFQIMSKKNRGYSNIEKLIEVFDETITSEIIRINKDIYKQLEAEYESLTTREQILETLSCNDYYFDEYGNVVDKESNIEDDITLRVLTSDDLTMMRGNLNSLLCDCEMAISGEWDVTTEEGRESFNNMIELINEIQTKIS